MSAATKQIGPNEAADDSTAVAPGWKRTDVGVIPEDWTTARLAQLSAFITKGATPTTYGFKWEESGVLFLRSECVSAEGLDLAQSMYISTAAHATLGRSDVRDGDILITITGNVGRVVLLARVGFANINQHIARVRIVANNVDGRFVFYYLSQDQVRQNFETITTGQAYPQISLVQVRDAQVVLPHPPEQRAIANALSDVDGLLEALEALIAKKRAIKQAAMQQLLTGKTRLPGFSGPWETKRLGEIAEIEMGQSPSSAFYNSDGRGLPLIQGNADIADRRTIRRIFTTQITKRGHSGDILMSVRAPVGEVSRATFDVCLGRGVCALRFPNDFLYHYLIHLEPSWARHSKGSTFDSVNSADVRAVEISVPKDRAEQTSIATVLSDMDAGIAALERRRDKTRAIKQGMMQQLLGGRVRLIAPDQRESNG